MSCLFVYFRCKEWVDNSNYYKKFTIDLTWPQFGQSNLRIILSMHKRTILLSIQKLGLSSDPHPRTIPSWPTTRPPNTWPLIWLDSRFRWSLIVSLIWFVETSGRCLKFLTYFHKGPLTRQTKQTNLIGATWKTNKLSEHTFIFYSNSSIMSRHTLI